MRLIYALLFLLCTIPAWGRNVISRIHDIDYGRGQDDEILVLLESGHVLKIENAKYPLVLKRHQKYEFHFDNERFITKVFPRKEDLEIRPKLLSIRPYEPTIVSGGRQAKKYFNQSRVSHGDTQCFNRAHVWSYELWKNHKVKSQKIFLFFSRRYIREYNFEWWFHVAPMLITKEWGNIEEKVLDPRYVRAPRDVQWWTDKFVSTKEVCKKIEHYSEYADYPYSRDCFIMKAPMYIYQPLDLEMMEVWDVRKDDFMIQDLRWAYKEAFNMEFEGAP